MNYVDIIISFVGGLALFIYGMQIMAQGLQNAAGSKMKQLLKKVSPFNNSTEMPVSLFIVKKILAFWVCYIAGLFIAEGLVYS